MAADGTRFVFLHNTDDKQPSSGRVTLLPGRISRHWECGPQRDFFLPECWLNFGTGQKNVLVFGLRQIANGARLQAMEIRPYENAAELR